MKVTLILDDTDEFADVDDSSKIVTEMNDYGPELTTYTMTGSMVNWRRLLNNLQTACEVHFGYEFSDKDVE